MTNTDTKKLRELLERVKDTGGTLYFEGVFDQKQINGEFLLPVFEALPSLLDELEGLRERVSLEQFIGIVRFDISMLEKEPSEEEKWVAIGMKRALNHIDMLAEMKAARTHKQEAE